jgi:Thioesterase-like superfamily
LVMTPSGYSTSKSPALCSDSAHDTLAHNTSGHRGVEMTAADIPTSAHHHLSRTAPGRYERQLDRSWWAQGVVHGGYVHSLAIAAFEHDLAATDMAVQQVTLNYLRPFTEGPFRAELTTERQGRRMLHASIRLFSNGRLAAVGLGCAAVLREISEVTLASAPDVSPYEPGAPVRPSVRADEPIMGRFQLHPRIHRRSSDGVQVGGWLVPTSAEPIDHRWLAIVADLWPPPFYRAWDKPYVLSTTELAYCVRAELPRDDLPAGSPVLVVLTSRKSSAGLVDEDAEIWSASGVLLAQSRQMRFINQPRTRH